MNDDFNRLSEAVMHHITAQNRGRSTRNAYRRCFCSLRTYLNEKGVVYSPDEAAIWLSSVRTQVCKTDLSLFSAAVNKLNDICLYGEVRKGHYNPLKTIAGKLCPEFKRIHRLLLEHISGLAEDTVSTHSWQCASILLRFQENGIQSAAGITYGTLLNEFNSSAKKTYCARSMHHENLRLLLRFLYDNGLAPYGFTLFVDAMSLRTGSYWNRMPEEQISAFRSAQDNTGTNLDVFLEMRETVFREHCHENYSRTTRRGIIRITNLFYLFMDMNRLCYSPAVGEAWLCSVKPSLDDIEYKHFRRVLCLMAQQHRKAPLRLNSYFVFRKTAYQSLPDWCRPEVDCFLRIKTGEGCIVLSEKTRKHMDRYLKTYHGEDRGTASRPLFYTVIHGNVSAMSVRNVERILNKYGTKARQQAPGIPDSVSPHTVRRSRATSLYRDGVPLEQVSALIGHSQIETTRSYYASPSPEQMKAAVEKGSNREPDQLPEWLGHTDDLKKKLGLA